MVGWSYENKIMTTLLSQSEFKILIKNVVKTDRIVRTDLVLRIQDLNENVVKTDRIARTDLVPAPCVLSDGS